LDSFNHPLSASCNGQTAYCQTGSSGTGGAAGASSCPPGYTCVNSNGGSTGIGGMAGATGYVPGAGGSCGQSDVCGVACCPMGQFCGNTATGLCCASQFAGCGDTCCGLNQRCLDPLTGTCAPSCDAGRFAGLEPASSLLLCTDVSDGSGLVLDNVTGLVWTSRTYNPVGGETLPDGQAYCEGRGMRLPSQDEVLAVASADRGCAFMCQWWTWTSTPSASGLGTGVAYDLSLSEIAGASLGRGVLCVR
jgi:hypothetical protein